jgi:hypothetical protein
MPIKIFIFNETETDLNKFDKVDELEPRVLRLPYWLKNTSNKMLEW